MANSTGPIKRTFLKEGGITIDNKDSGGLTYLGLAYNFWPHVPVWPKILKTCVTILNKNGIKVTETDLKNLGTKNGKNIDCSTAIKNEINKELSKLGIKKEIILFYKKEFWDTIKGDDICSQSFAESLFDFGVNVYWKTAAKILQKLIKVDPDGNIGQITTYVLNCELIENHHELHTQFALTKVIKYYKICTENKEKLKYLNGWLNRTFETYQSIYTIDDLQKMISLTSQDGMVGPKKLKGYKTFLNNEEHYKALMSLLKIYEYNESCSNKKITSAELLNKIAAQIN